MLGREQVMVAACQQQQHRGHMEHRANAALQQPQPSPGLAPQFQQHSVTLANTQCVTQQDLATAAGWVLQNMLKCPPTANIVIAVVSVA